MRSIVTLIATTSTHAEVLTKASKHFTPTRHSRGGETFANAVAVIPAKAGSRFTSAEPNIQGRQPLQPAPDRWARLRGDGGEMPARVVQASCACGYPWSSERSTPTAMDSRIRGNDGIGEIARVTIAAVDNDMLIGVPA